MSEFSEVLRYREVLWNLVRRNLKVRYKNSVLGFAWSLLNPLLQIGVWWFLFKVILPGRGEANFMAILVTGFLPWLFFSQTVLDSTACVTQEMALIKKAYFPRTILPLSVLLSNLIHLGFAFIVMIGLFIFWRVDVNIHYLLVIPSTLLLVIFAYGLSTMLAAWSAFYADVKFIVSNLLGLWFFLVPILYPLYTALGADRPAGNWLETLIHHSLSTIKHLYLLDPVTIVIVGYRSALLHGGQPIVVTITDNMTKLEQQDALIKQAVLRAEYPMLPYVIGAVIISLAAAIIGHWIYQRKAGQFAEQG